MVRASRKGVWIASSFACVPPWPSLSSLCEIFDATNFFSLENQPVLSRIVSRVIWLQDRYCAYFVLPCLHYSTKGCLSKIPSRFPGNPSTSFFVLNVFICVLN
jgi:hypothetical protein